MLYEVISFFCFLLCYFWWFLSGDWSGVDKRLIDWVSYFSASIFLMVMNVI